MDRWSWRRPQRVRHVRRHVVSLGHRLRSLRAGSRRGWQVPARGAELRRLPARGRLLCRAFRTTRVVLLGRSSLTNDGPGPTVEVITSKLKIYPYTPGGVGLPIARFLEGGVQLGQNTDPQKPVLHDGTGLSINAIPSNDFSYYEMLNRLVKSEPAAVLDPELMGPIAAIGIRKGEDFAPDDRMRQILIDAVAVANATGRNLGFAPLNPAWYF